MSSPLDALELSVDHLRALTEPMEESQYVASAYPTEWTVADTMSHIGSAAIISKRRIDDALDGRETPSEFNQSVWDVWNLKTPHAQVTDALVADRALLTRLQEMTPDERSSYHLNLGPMTFDFDGVVRLRLGEHTVHTWDIEESVDAQATLQPESVPFLIDNLELVIRFTAKSVAEGHVLHIRTTSPARELTLTQGADGVTLVDAKGVTDFDLELPAEAFVRLAYGRMDEGHTPAGVDTTHLDELRRVFPGM